MKEIVESKSTPKLDALGEGDIIYIFIYIYIFFNYLFALKMSLNFICYNINTNSFNIPHFKSVISVCITGRSNIKTKYNNYLFSYIFALITFCIEHKPDIAIFCTVEHCRLISLKEYLQDNIKIEVL